MDAKEPLARAQSLAPCVLAEGRSEEQGCPRDPITSAAPHLPSGQPPWSALPATGGSIDARAAKNAHISQPFLDTHVEVQSLLES